MMPKGVNRLRMMQRRRLNPFVQKWIWSKGDVIAPCPTLKHAVDAALAVYMIDIGVEAVPDRHAFRDVLMASTYGYYADWRWANYAAT